MNTMSHMLAILNYSGYAAYTKLAHGAKLSKQSMYKDSIFIKGTSISFPCDNIRRLLSINESINHSIWLEKLKLSSGLADCNNNCMIGFYSSSSLIWVENADNFHLLTNNQIVSQSSFSAPIINSLSSVNFCRQTKATSFSSYALHDLELWSLIRGNVLIKIKNVLKGIKNIEPMQPLEWKAFGAFMDMFFVELSRNPATLITLPMCFDIYNHLTNDKNKAHLNEFINKNSLYPERPNHEVLRCILTEYFPMSMTGALHVSIHFSNIIEQVLKENKLDKYCYSYDLRDGDAPSYLHISKFITIEKRLIKAYQYFISKFNDDIYSFAESLDNLLVSWYGSDCNIDGLCSREIANNAGNNNGMDTTIGIANNIYTLYE